MPPSPPQSPPSPRRPLLVLLSILIVVIGGLFYKLLLPGWVMFNNDNPLGALQAQSAGAWHDITSAWSGLNWLGIGGPGGFVRLSHILFASLGPYYFLKLMAPLSLVILGLSAGFFFRQLKFTPLACVLGGLGVALHSDFFSNACWGQVSRPLTLALSFLALGLLENGGGFRSWMKVALAGMAVGMGVMEGFDIGAIFSVFVAAYVLFHAWVTGAGSPLKRLILGGARVAVVAGFAGLMGAQAISGLVGTQIKGVAIMDDKPEGKQERWDWATQWSYPKIETLGIFIPGVFGYRMDTPDGGNYWGTCGQTPGWETHHQGFARYGGGGPYAGVLVAAVALWALLASLRKQGSPYTVGQRQFIWFWMGLALVCLLLAFGRHAPFYQLFYLLPGVSTMRNPNKFIHVFDWSLLVIFGYGLHGLIRTYMDKPAAASARFGDWWAKAGAFEKKWVFGSVAAVIASILGWVIYGSSRAKLVAYLQTVAFDEGTAEAIARFSIHSVGVFILLLTVALGLVVLVMSGKFSGSRAKWGGVLLGLFLVFDQGRVDVPTVVFVNAPEKYTTNPVIEFLRQKPYEQRVTMLPFPMPKELAMFQQLYGSEWTQHLFPYYGIHCLDVIQLPRPPLDYIAYESALRPEQGNAATLTRIPRKWELTNTRYVLGPAGYLEALNTQLDPTQRRFRVAQTFDIVPKPGVTAVTRFEDLTAEVKPGGQFAVFEFAGALPRAKLYTNWQVNTNDEATLQQLTDKAFDPAASMLVANNIPQPTATTNHDAGKVEIVSYAPKAVQLRAQVNAPALLLLNDRYDPSWTVTVDGKPATLLRCNYLMRGVRLDKGEHTVEFRYAPPDYSIYVSLGTMVLGVILIGLVVASRPKNQRTV